MSKTTNTAALLRNDLEKLLTTLKRNRKNVPLEMLKTKYAAGYSALCGKIRQTASSYLKETVLDDIRIDKEYQDIGIALIQNTINDSGILKQLSFAAFHCQDMNHLDTLATQLREKVLSELDTLCSNHLGLYISNKCLVEPYPIPEIYCLVNGCILQGSVWIPLEDFQKQEETKIPGSQPAEPKTCT